MKMTATDSHEPVIEVEEVTKSFGDLHVLRRVNLEVLKGENLAILGKSGSGKSVLIKLMVGLLKPDQGQVRVLGKKVAGLGRKELDQLRLRIGFSFQNSALYDSMSVFENLAFPLTMNGPKLTKKEVGLAVDEALEAVGLKEKGIQMPSDLSGGQRKRIGIARTLILKPEIMLYDEPTSGLDPVTSTEINELINDMQQQYNTTSIIITHDLTCAKTTAQRVAMLLDGKFSKIGTFEEVFDTNDRQIMDFYSYNFIE